jgi:hypothetical protein
MFDPTSNTTYVVIDRWERYCGDMQAVAYEELTGGDNLLLTVWLDGSRKHLKLRYRVQSSMHITSSSS